ncbi:MAG: AraC family transcriptional regulator [Clostridiales bacterium]|nr:AraC family transcriptional regulator [Clostridiales bacterium]
MTIKEVKDLIEGKDQWTGYDEGKEIQSAYVSDLLSLVMANGKKDMVWVTVQNHLNVIAVAALMELAVVILVEGIHLEEDIAKKAQEKNIPVITTSLSAYTVCGILHNKQIKGSR